MCRLYGFRSAIDSTVHRSLVDAENAMALQSSRHKDGWGIAYYVGRFPQIIRNDQQALGDSLFREVSGVVATRTFMAHIRQATAGSVRVLNCHPFQHGGWTFAHNGQVCTFGVDPSVRQRVLGLIDGRYRRFVLGDTDSELLFYVFLSRLSRMVDDLQSAGITADHAVSALRESVAEVLAASPPPEADPERPTRLNFLLTNGNVLIGYRRGVTLYYSTHKSRCLERESCWAYEPGRCEAAVQDGIVKHLLVSSEVIAGGTNVWEEMADDEYVCVDHGMNFKRGRLVGDLH